MTQKTNSLGLPVNDQSVLAVPPSLVIYGPPGVGKSQEVGRAFQDALFITSSPTVLRGLETLKLARPDLVARLPDTFTIPEYQLDEKGNMVQFDNLGAVEALLTRFGASVRAGKCEYSGLVFDEWSTFGDRIWKEMQADTQKRYRTSTGRVDYFRVIDAFKALHRRLCQLPRVTGKMLTLICHWAEPKFDEEENSPTKGTLKYPGGPKMPIGTLITPVCAEADAVLQMVVGRPSAAAVLEGNANGNAVQRKFLTQPSETWYRKVRDFRAAPEEVLDIEKGHGLREILARLGYPV